MITQKDIDLAQVRIDKARDALRAYTERVDDQPTDIRKHDALAEQLRSAINDFDGLVAARLRHEQKKPGYDSGPTERSPFVAERNSATTCPFPRLASLQSAVRL